MRVNPIVVLRHQVESPFGSFLEFQANPVTGTAGVPACSVDYTKSEVTRGDRGGEGQRSQHERSHLCCLAEDESVAERIVRIEVKLVATDERRSPTHPRHNGIIWTKPCYISDFN